MGYDYFDFADIFESVQGLEVVMAMYLGILAFAVIIGIVDYILRGIAINSMCKNRGIDNGWLGFIPIARDYQLGVLSGEIDLGKKKMKNVGVWLIVTPIVVSVVTYIFSMVMMFVIMFSTAAIATSGSISGVGLIFFVYILFLVVVMIAAGASQIVRGLAMYGVFSHYSTGGSAVFKALFALVMPFGEAIMLFANRNKQPIGYVPPAPAYQPAPQSYGYQQPAGNYQPYEPVAPVTSVASPVPAAPVAPVESAPVEEAPSVELKLETTVLEEVEKTETPESEQK